MNDSTLQERFRILDGNRSQKLARARFCSSLTIPMLLPPEGWEEGRTLPQPYSSVASRGVTSLSSRILSALMPLNDAPFFRFILKDGSASPHELEQYLEVLAYQVYRKLTSGNLRETVYHALQHLVVCGDVLVAMDDSFLFTVYRLDQFVVQRDVMGEVMEIIHLEYEALDPNALLYQQTDIEYRHGYKTLYCQYTKNADKTWSYRKEDCHGNVEASGQYTVLPMTVLRWYSITGENYGRSHCEDILGDIKALEAYTKAQIEGMAAASAFWIAVDPAGVTEMDDIASAQNGTFVPARQQDLFVLTPAATVSPQIGAASQAVENMRREIGQAFLMSAQAIPSGDRVTATAVRMIGSELETVLGGAFSAIARTLMEPIVQRTVALMLESGDLDPRLYEQFFEADGTISISIVTGLQALSRDSDLQKLMQLGEMVRNLPPEALATFRWDAYASALITSLGFDPRMWIKSEEEIVAAQQEAQAQQAALETKQTTSSAVGSAFAGAAGSAAEAALMDPALQAQAIQAIQGGLPR